MASLQKKYIYIYFQLILPDKRHTRALQSLRSCIKQTFESSRIKLPPENNLCIYLKLYSR